MKRCLVFRGNTVEYDRVLGAAKGQVLIMVKEQINEYIKKEVQWMVVFV